MTDTYEFAKSCIPQGVENETPYLRRVFLPVNKLLFIIVAGIIITIIK